MVPVLFRAYDGDKGSQREVASLKLNSPLTNNVSGGGARDRAIAFFLSERTRFESKDELGFFDSELLSIYSCLAFGFLKDCVVEWYLTFLSMFLFPNIYTCKFMKLLAFFYRFLRDFE